jgi:RES domain-containing protein
VAPDSDATPRRLRLLKLPAPRIRIAGTWWRVTRSTADPLALTPEPADGRWQRGSVIRALYLGDTEETVWAEWYRHTSEAGVPPDQRLPRAMWRVDVDLEDVADLTGEGVLAAHGIDQLDPSRRQWTRTQQIGQAYWRDGASAVLAPSAARADGLVLAVFRTAATIPGVAPVPPPRRFRSLPPIPKGLRT